MYTCTVYVTKRPYSFKANVMGSYSYTGIFGVTVLDRQSERLKYFKTF